MILVSFMRVLQYRSYEPGATYHKAQSSLCSPCLAGWVDGPDMYEYQLTYTQQSLPVMTNEMFSTAVHHIRQ